MKRSDYLLPYPVGFVLKPETQTDWARACRFLRRLKVSIYQGDETEAAQILCAMMVMARHLHPLRHLTEEEIRAGIREAYRG